MKIEVEVKYNVGDKVWICSYGEAKEATVSCVHATVYLDRVSYYYELVGVRFWWWEAQIYATKEECEKAIRRCFFKEYGR